MIPKRWIVREQETERAASVGQAIGVSQVVAAPLFARGCVQAECSKAFLHPSFEQLSDPYLMLGMREAVSRLLYAIDHGERVLIYGDYDVDGTTGTALLLRGLELLGAQTGYHVPHRFREGYGIQQPALEQAVADGYNLVVSVDCGIRAHD